MSALPSAEMNLSVAARASITALAIDAHAANADLGRLPRPPQGRGASSIAGVNASGLDLSSMRLALLCAELGSLSRAAKCANMSLSCASHRLSTLEELLRTRLFVRRYQGLAVTEAGAVVVAHARDMLDALCSMRIQLERLPQSNAATAPKDNRDQMCQSWLRR